MSSGKGNTRGGKGYKRGKTNRVKPSRRDFHLDVEGGEGYFGIVTKLAGDNTIMVNLNNGTTGKANIPGRMRKKSGQWIKVGFTVLLSKDDEGNLEVVKIVRENDKDAKEATTMMKDSTNREIGDDDIEMVEGNANRPNKQTLKKRDITRGHDRDTEHFTDPTLLKIQAEQLTSGDESDDEKDKFGNTVEKPEAKKKGGKKKQQSSSETTEEITKPTKHPSKIITNSDDDVDIDDI
jgi:translation initiation factor IF-1